MLGGETDAQVSIRGVCSCLRAVVEMNGFKTAITVDGKILDCATGPECVPSGRESPSISDVEALCKDQDVICKCT